MIKNIDTKKILILSGLMSKYDDIGTEGLFSIVNYPYTDESIIKCISDIIDYEIYTMCCVKMWIELPPYNKIEHDILKRGIGVCIWECSEDESFVINNNIGSKNKRRHRHAITAINNITNSSTPIVFNIQEEITDYKKYIKIIRDKIFHILK